MLRADSAAAPHQGRATAAPAWSPPAPAINHPGSRNPRSPARAIHPHHHHPPPPAHLERHRQARLLKAPAKVHRGVERDAAGPLAISLAALAVDVCGAAVGKGQVDGRAHQLELVATGDHCGGAGAQQRRGRRRAARRGAAGAGRRWARRRARCLAASQASCARSPGRGQPGPESRGRSLHRPGLAAPGAPARIGSTARRSPGRWPSSPPQRSAAQPSP
jgi:hypothetical protein